MVYYLLINSIKEKNTAYVQENLIKDFIFAKAPTRKAASALTFFKEKRKKK